MTTKNFVNSLDFEQLNQFQIVKFKKLINENNLKQIVNKLENNEQLTNFDNNIRFCLGHNCYAINKTMQTLKVKDFAESIGLTGSEIKLVKQVLSYFD